MTKVNRSLPASSTHRYWPLTPARCSIAAFILARRNSGSHLAARGPPRGQHAHACIVVAGLSASFYGILLFSLQLLILLPQLTLLWATGVFREILACIGWNCHDVASWTLQHGNYKLFYDKTSDMCTCLCGWYYTLSVSCQKIRC